MTLRARGEIYYAWSASDPAESALNATTLVLSRIIEEGCDEGFRVFDMGESPKEHEGLVRFKTRWCPVSLETHSYFLLGRASAPPVHFYGGFGWQKRVIAHLPVALTTHLVSPLLRFVV